MVCSHGVPPCSSALLCVLLLVLIVTMTTGVPWRPHFFHPTSKEERISMDHIHGVVTLISSHALAGEIRSHEEECLREGGICVEKSACPLDKMVNKTGVCPEQEHKGAVCCNAVPDTETSCRQNGGNCGGVEACANVPSFGQLDCEEGTECCLLIF